MWAADISGQVVAVADGDTLTVLGNSRQYKIRLAEIDAPERGQPFGQRSKQSLADVCFGRLAIVEDKGTDRYGRTVGRVSCNGVDANVAQLRKGMAWVYDRYNTDTKLYAVQRQARSGRHGLWLDPNPIPPWEWRKARRENRVAK